MERNTIPNLIPFFDNAWCWIAGIEERPITEYGKSELGTIPDSPLLYKLQIVKEFDELTKLGNNRMIMGVFRYKLRKGHDFINYDVYKEILKKLSLYERSHNIEDLVDAFNYLRIEFLKAKTLGYPFKSIDDGEHAEYKGKR